MERRTRSFFRRFSFCGVFYLESSVGEAIPLSFDSSSILTEVLAIHVIFFCRFLEKKMLTLVCIFYLEISVGFFSVLKLV